MAQRDFGGADGRAPEGGSAAGGDAPAPKPAPRKTASGGFVRNILANIVGLGVTLLVGILFTPYLVRSLGLDGYALVPLANTVSAFLTPITIALSTPFARDLVVALERKGKSDPDVVFSSGLFGSVLLSVVVAVLAAPIVISPSTFFRLSPGYERDSQLLLAGSAGSFVLTTLSTPFESVSFCRNRFDVRNLIIILNTTARVSLIVALFVLLGPRPRYVGLGFLAGAVVSACLTFVAYRKLLPEVRVRLSLVRAAACLGFVRTGAWVLIMQIGTVLFLNVDIVVVNRMVGPREAGLYSLALVWSTLLLSLSNAVSSVFAPKILQAYGRADGSFAQASRQGVRLVSLIMALPVAGIAGLAPGLLRAWQGPDFVELAPLLAILTGVHLVTLGFQPLSSVFVASDRVRAPAVAQIIAGLVKIAVAVVLVQWAGLGMYGVAIAGGLLLIARGSAYNALLASKITGVPALAYVGDVLPAAAVGAVSLGLAWWTASVLHIASWIQLGMVAAGQAAVYSVATWLFVLTSHEKLFMRRSLQRIPLLRRAGT